MNTESTEKQPTKEEVKAWYMEQIEMAKLRHELAKLQSETVQEEARRIQATMMIAQMQAPMTSDEPENEEMAMSEEKPTMRSLKREK